MSKERELLQEALEWMEELNYVYADSRNSGDRLALELRADINKVELLLTQPEQPNEPVAWLHEWVDETGETVRSIYSHFYEHINLIPLYTSHTTRKPLSDDEIDILWGNEKAIGLYSFARVIEKHHGITGERNE